MKIIRSTEKLGDGEIQMILPETIDTDLILDDWGKHGYRVMAFISYLYCEWLKGYLEDSYFQISKNTPKRYMGNYYRRRVDYLINKEILEVDESYVSSESSGGDGKCKGYRLRTEIREGGLVRYALKNKPLWNLRTHYKKADQKQLRSYPPTYQEIISNMKKLQVHRDADSPIYDEDVSHEQVLKYEYILQQFRERNYWHTLSANTGRLYNNVANCPKAMRPHLMIDGKRLTEIDVVSCQPFLLLSLYEGHEIGEKLKLLQVLEDSDFYNYLNERMKVPHPTRKGIKTDIYQSFLFNRPVRQSEMWKLFKKEFPALAEKIWAVNKEEHNRLALKLQSLEAEIVIKNACSKLLQEGILVLTVHDSILCMGEHKGVVAKQLQQSFEEVIGHSPKLTVVDYEEEIKDSEFRTRLRIKPKLKEDEELNTAFSEFFTL